MNFQEGDSVMHWTHGLGKVVGLATMDLVGKKTLYYAIQVGDLTVWVPADEQLESRLRHPTPAAEFKRLMESFSRPGEPLPVDPYERKKLLLQWLRTGSSESLFRVVCSLSTYHHDGHPLKENDQALMKRVQNALLGEWSFALSVSLAQAERELRHMLASHSAATPTQA